MTEFEKQLHDMFDHIWECEIDHPVFQDTVGDLMSAVIQAHYNSAQPERKGRWIPVDSFSAFGGDEETWMAHGNPVAFHYCSECKNHAHADEFGKELLTSFCPECGADMRGDDE